MEQPLMEKLTILADSAKYDVACTSSGASHTAKAGSLGSCYAPGCCHAFTADGRCVSLLKVLMTNCCAFDCSYCVNRRTNDIPRATFTPRELAELTIGFYRRNYIEGLFLSSGIQKNPDYTMEQMYQTIYLLRTKYKFNGYIHVKAIPGADSRLIQMTGYLADRMSVNIELPTAESLRLLAPHKTRKNILAPMRFVQQMSAENQYEIQTYRHVPKFVPAGQSTQMIIGATPESDYQILHVAESLYKKFDLKRVFYSAFIPVNEDKNLPSVKEQRPPLLREHRLYQADWLLRYYHFEAGELLDEENPNFNAYLDPKCFWALRHLEEFPIEINYAAYDMLLRVPGIGYKSASRIVKARRMGMLDFEDLKKMGVVLKRALYFITCKGKMMYPIRMDEDYITRNLLNTKEKLPEGADGMSFRQLSLFDDMGIE